MAVDIELLITGKESVSGKAVIDELCDGMAANGITFQATSDYRGIAPWLVLWGVGRRECMAARTAHIARKGRTASWDLGYFGREKGRGYMRVSVDIDHPWPYLDRTPADPSRFAALGVTLREDADPDGHVVLVGMGRKSRAQLSLYGWEQMKLSELRRRFPGRRIVYRPKRATDDVILPVETVADGPIEDVLRGASLVVTRHSNVAVDAVVAGVPFECENGAAYWLRQKPFTRENRLDFLHRLAWWQWRPFEATEGLKFVMRIA